MMGFWRASGPTVVFSTAVSWRRGIPASCAKHHSSASTRPQSRPRSIEAGAGSLAAAVAGLPVKLREPVLLHFASGLAYREIALVLGTGLGTVSRRMTKALAHLKPHLGDLR